MAGKLLTLGGLILVALMVLASCDESVVDKDVETGEPVSKTEQASTTEQEQDAPKEEERMKLYQRPPVEAGHIQVLDIPSFDGTRTIQLKTLAVNPPVFEIKNLLTPAECDHMIELGEQKGLQASATVTWLFDKKYNVFKKDGITLAYDQNEWTAKFNQYDANGDGYIDYVEAHKCIPGLKETEHELTLEQIQNLYTALYMDANSDILLDLKEFWVMQTREYLDAEVIGWIIKLDAGQIDFSNPGKGRDRISEQAWLNWLGSKDTLLADLPKRLSGLTGLNDRIIRLSEQIQVVRYYPGGHYHAHHDTQEIDHGKDCIHTKMKLEKVKPNHPKGRLCRFITIMYYLSDVEEGGETAFPIADNATYDQVLYKKQEGTITDLSHHCHEGNAIVKPEKGKVVMWYNHDVDPETGWLGQLNKRSLHGGCDVIKGVKWIANNWITVDDVYERQMRFHDAYFPPSETTPAPKNDDAARDEL